MHNILNTIKNQPLFLVAPIMIVGWGIFTARLFFPYYSWAIDPEFPYLVNGLNVALLEFNRIGHFDHPGTPFQLFNGIAIRLIHIFSGDAPLTQDLFNRPEHYLKGINLLLVILQACLTLAIAIIGRNRGVKTLHLLILQAGLLFSDMLLSISARAIPERWFVITTTLFVLTYLQHAYQYKNPVRFAIWSGVVMGMGLATKFNYLPLLLLPLFILRHNKLRAIYAGATAASFFVFILPIINRFKEYREFITSIAKHDGIYGGGEPRVINPESFRQGLSSIFQHTPELAIWIGIIAAALIVSLYYLKKRHTGSYALIFGGFLAIILLQLVIVAKHYKAVYMAPLHSLYGFILFTISLFLFELFPKKWWQVVFITALFALFGYYNIHRINRDFPYTKQYLEQREEIRNFVDQKIPENAAWFVEPSWLDGPHVENGFVFGLSYSRQRHKYLPELTQVNPNLVTYEWNPDEVKLWRGQTVDLDSIIMGGTTLYVYDTPGRHPQLLIEMVQKAAERNKASLLVDTLFSQYETKSHILGLTVSH